MDRLGGWRPIAALAATYVAVIAFFAVVYGGGLGVGAFAALEFLAMLALAGGVAWASARRR